MTLAEAGCVLLPWDTQFFGHAIARLQSPRLTPQALTAALAFCARENVECLYFLAASDDPTTIGLAEDAGFRLIDVRMTFGRRAAPTDADAAGGAAPGVVVRPAAPRDHAPLRRLAELSYAGTRFAADPRLAPRAPALYARWLERSLEAAGGAVLVADVDGHPAGYLTCAVDAATREGNIGLVAVSSAVQRRGVGAGLLREALAWFARAGAEHTTVVTQGRNVAAHALYQRAGFITRSVELWFHKWF